MIAGACLASLSLAVGSAMADPSGAPTFRNVAGTGSDTTQGVLNALSNDILIGGVKQIGSYDAASATNSATITTKDPAVNSHCTINRPSGSNAGINALAADRAAGTHCLQFARSSADNHTDPSHANQHLTYIPFATDSVAYAVRETSSTNRNLSVASLLSIYNCTAPAGVFEPLLPQFNSGTRKFFLENVLHVPGGDRSTYTTEFPCVKDVDSNNNPLLENTGNLLTNDKQIEPYSVSSWIAQTSKNVTDVHGITLLGNIDGKLSLALNTTATGVRPVFNVVPNVLQVGPSNTRTVFVGPNSLVCADKATIQKQGFALNSSCGDVSIQTDSSNGTDTVGPGE